MRLDHYLVAHQNLTRSRAQLLIKDGAVLVNNIPVTKPNYDVKTSDQLSLHDTIKYVSRAGLKLEYALDIFQINPNGMTCLDIGSSTGGFTDCLIQRNALHVDSVDVGTEQLAPSLRNNPQVSLYEQTDIRVFQNTQTYDLIVCDASFISLKNILPEIPRFAKRDGYVILLIKPQFEVGRDFLGKGGIVTDEMRVIEIITDIVTCAKKHNLRIFDEVKLCPVRGGDGNQEYLVCFTYQKK